MRLQKLVLESCNLCLVGFADGLDERGQDGRIFRKELAPHYDFMIVLHDETKVRMEWSEIVGEGWVCEEGTSA